MYAGHFANLRRPVGDGTGVAAAGAAGGVAGGGVGIAIDWAAAPALGSDDPVLHAARKVATPPRAGALRTFRREIWGGMGSVMCSYSVPSLAAEAPASTTNV